MINCNVKRWALAGVAAFAVIFVLDFIIHEKILRGVYQEYALVWRPNAEIMPMMWIMTLGALLFSLVFACFYTKGYEANKGGLGQGLRFGFYVGLILAAYQGLSWYVVLPIPLSLAVAWLAGAMVKSICAGAAVGLIYRN